MEKNLQERNQKRKWNMATLAQIGMLAAVAVVLMLFEIPLPFAPSFYQIDFSEVPVLIGCFALGPAAGVLIELVKIALHLLFHGSHTMGVGDLANFLIGCGLCLPAGLIYKKIRTRKGALLGMLAGTLVMTIGGCLINAFVLLPLYAKMLVPSLDVLIEMGTAVNGRITDLFTFVVFAVAPFNLLKGFLDCTIVFFVYKRVSPLLNRYK